MFFFESDVSGSVVIRSSGTEPTLKAYISVTVENKVVAAEEEEEMERQITADLEKRHWGLTPLRNFTIGYPRVLG